MTKLKEYLELKKFDSHARASKLESRLKRIQEDTTLSEEEKEQFFLLKRHMQLLGINTVNQVQI